jgi:hypothetical protein
MKKLLLLLVIISQVSFAQEPQIVWNTANTKPNLDITTKFYGNLTDGIYLYNNIPPSGMEFNPSITVECFNDKLDRNFKKNITVEPLEDFVNVVYLNKKVYHFKSLFSKDAGKNTLNAIGINPDGSFDKPIAIGNINAEKLAKRGRFEVASSPDGKKLVILSEPEWIKDENEKITISLYNEKLEKIYSTEQTYSYPWTRAVYNEPFVNNDGTVFILKKTDMKGEGNTYSVFSFNGKSLKEFKIQLDGNKKAATMVKTFSPEGNLTIAGYYTEDAKVKIGTGTAYHGSFINSYDKSGETTKITAVNPFEKRKDIAAKSIIFNGNNIILMSEEIFVNAKSAGTSQDMFAKDYSYYANNIWIDGFDASGKSIYGTSIKKDNSSNNDFGRWNSYFSALMKGKIYVIFNDEKYKYDEKKKAVIFGGSPKIAVYATVDPNTGVAASTKPMAFIPALYGEKETPMFLHPDVYLKLNDNQCIIKAENTDLYRFGMMGF